MKHQKMMFLQIQQRKLSGCVAYLTADIIGKMSNENSN